MSVGPTSFSGKPEEQQLKHLIDELIKMHFVSAGPSHLLLFETVSNTIFQEFADWSILSPICDYSGKSIYLVLILISINIL